MDVHLPPSLARLFDGCPTTVSVEASTLGEAVAELDRRWPGMHDRLCSTPTSIREHIHVLSDGRRIAWDDPLPAGAEVDILLAMSGGSG